MLETVCPECGSLLDHTKESPGGVDAPTKVNCPECEYEDLVED